MPDPGATESVGTNRRRWFKVALVAGGTVVTAAAGRAALGIKFSENNQQQPQAGECTLFGVCLVHKGLKQSAKLQDCWQPSLIFAGQKGTKPPRKLPENKSLSCNQLGLQ